MKTYYKILPIIGLSIFSPSCDLFDDGGLYRDLFKESSMGYLAVNPITTDLFTVPINPKLFPESSEEVAYLNGQNHSHGTTESEAGQRFSETVEWNPTEDVASRRSRIGRNTMITETPSKTNLPPVSGEISSSPSHTGDDGLIIYEASYRTLTPCNISSTNVH